MESLQGPLGFAVRLPHDPVEYPPLLGDAWPCFTKNKRVPDCGKQSPRLEAPRQAAGEAFSRNGARLFGSRGNGDSRQKRKAK